MALTDCHRGRLVARILQGAWRDAPPGLACSTKDLAEVTPFLLASGAGALGWRRIAGSSLRVTVPGQALRQAFRGAAVQNLRHEHHLAQLLPTLARAGIDCLLIKGRALAPFYSVPELRPFGDVYLCVSPQQFSDACRLLKGMPHKAHGIDLHQGMPDLPDRTWDQIQERARVLPLSEATVRVLGPEDQLRHLCLHQARHGCWRPVWLCDVAAALEHTPPDFDWDYCLRGWRRCTRWVLCVIGLAQQLLGARPPGSVPQPQGYVPPAWIRDQLLRGWGQAGVGDSHTRDHQPLLSSLRQPARLGHALRSRWPNPIEALFKANGAPESPWPKILFQAFSSLRRCLDLCRRWREARRDQNDEGSVSFSVHLHETVCR